MDFKVTNYKLLLFFLSIIITSVIFLCFSIVKTQISCDDCSFEVYKNENAYQIAYRLESMNILNEPHSFLLASKILFLDKSIKPGNYDLSNIYNIKSLLLLLTSSGYDYISITIPEGWSINQISKKLESHNLVDPRIFDSLCSDYRFIYSLGLEKLNNLEGYLFPETYFISSSQTEKQIIEMMVQQFEISVKSHKFNFKQYGFNFHDLITLASIIQGEAMDTDEMQIIASVFHNRLNKKMFLDANATIQYIIPGKNIRLMNKDLEINNSYNTYKYKGLTPGPINNPELSAIFSACNPQKTDYLYFVKDPDNFGKHIFNKTFSNHEKSRKKYLRSLK